MEMNRFEGRAASGAAVGVAPSSSSSEAASYDVALLAELRGRSRTHVKDAIRLLPEQKRAAFMEAEQRSPEIIEAETDPLQFVRRCQYDIGIAAERLCLYWTERKRIFGEAKAFLPLVLTGEGALSTDDVLTLQAGFPALLPKTVHGKPAILFDRRNWIPNATFKNKLKSCMYLANILAQDDMAQTEGVLIIVLLSTPGRVVDLDQDFIRNVFPLFANALPIKFTMHFLAIPNSGKYQAMQDLMTAAVVPALDALGEESVDVHVEDDFSETFHTLGLTAAAIPLSIGGDWKVEEHFKWCQEQEKKEREKYKWLLSQHFSPTKKPQELSQAEKEEKRKLVHRLHSRRKRERQRQQVVDLENGGAELQQAHKTLKTENEHLHSLLSQAKALVETLK